MTNNFSIIPFNKNIHLKRYESKSTNNSNKNNYNNTKQQSQSNTMNNQNNNTGEKINISGNYKDMQASPMHLNWFEKFCLIISNADFDVLSQCPKADKNRLVTQGIIFLLISFFSFISFYYALLEVKMFNNVFLRVAMSIAYALVILNIDRYLVASVIVNPSDNVGKKFLNTFWIRFILTFFIGIIISKPFELEIFRDAIENKIIDKKLQTIDKINNKDFGDKTLSDYIKQLDNDIQKLETQQNEIRNQIQEQDRILSTRGKGYYIQKVYDKNNNLVEKAFLTAMGLTAKKIKTQLEKDLNGLNDQLITKRKELETKKSTLINQKLSTKKQFEDAEKSKDFMFIEKFKIFSQLKDEDSSIWWVSMAITLFFMLLDTMPVLSKMLSKSHYDLLIYQNYINKSNELKMNELKNEMQFTMYKFQLEKDHEKMKFHHEMEAINQQFLKEQQLSENQNKKAITELQNELEKESFKRNYYVNNKDQILEEQEIQHTIKMNESELEEKIKDMKLEHELNREKEKVKFSESIENMIKIMNKYSDAYNKHFDEMHI